MRGGLRGARAAACLYESLLDGGTLAATRSDQTGAGDVALYASFFQVGWSKAKKRKKRTQRRRGACTMTCTRLQKSGMRCVT